MGGVEAEAAARLVIGNQPEGWLLLVLDWNDARIEIVVATVIVNDPTHTDPEDKVCSWADAAKRKLIDFPEPVLTLREDVFPEVLYAALLPAGPREHPRGAATWRPRGGLRVVRDIRRDGHGQDAGALPRTARRHGQQPSRQGARHDTPLVAVVALLFLLAAIF
jgi:hypothetical protein